MFEQAFKNIDDILHKDAGCSSELDYTEQTSWLLFLKYLDALEQDKATEAQLEGAPTPTSSTKRYRWDTWAAPKGADGKIDHNRALTGDDLRDFVNGELFPYLHGFKQRASGPNTIEYKIGEVFGEIKNKLQSGYNLREVIDIVDGLRFRSQAEKHELSALYEDKIRRMGNAGRNGGEYYTPRPLIRAIIKVVDPKVGETDLRRRGRVSRLPLRGLRLPERQAWPDYQRRRDAAGAHLLRQGEEVPRLRHRDHEHDPARHRGTEHRPHQHAGREPRRHPGQGSLSTWCSPTRPSAARSARRSSRTSRSAPARPRTCSSQHFIKMLKAGGRAGIVIKNTFLSNTDNASVSLRKLLLESCNLHTVLDCPSGTFQGAGVKTVVLFFEKGAPTRRFWYYQLDPGRNMGKTNPLNDEDLAEFVEMQRTFADSPKSWSVDIADHRPDHVRPVGEEPRRRRRSRPPQPRRDPR